MGLTILLVFFLTPIIEPFTLPISKLNKVLNYRFPQNKVFVLAAIIKVHHNFFGDSLIKGYDLYLLVPWKIVSLISEQSTHFN